MCIDQMIYGSLIFLKKWQWIKGNYFFFLQFFLIIIFRLWVLNVEDKKFSGSRNEAFSWIDKMEIMAFGGNYGNFESIASGLMDV